MISVSPERLQLMTCGKVIIFTGLHKTGIRGIQDTRQIVNSKTNDKENNDTKRGSRFDNKSQRLLKVI